MTYIWLGLLILCIVAEVLTRRLWAACGCPGALVAFILALCSVDVWVQAVVFAALALLCLLLRVGLGRKRTSGKGAFSLEDVVGGQVTVIDRIDNVAGRGSVAVGDMQWAARALNDETILESGETVTVIAVEGVKLICK